MTRSFRVEPYLSPEEAQRIIDALLSSKGDSPPSREDRQLAGKITRNLTMAREQFEAEEAERVIEEARRAERARNHALTKTQAEALASVRAGKGPYQRWDSAWGHWRHSSNMGGARKRMVILMIEEGLLSDRRELTDEGRQRLESYEQKHGHIGVKS